MNALPIRKELSDEPLDENGQSASDIKIDINDLVSEMIQTSKYRDCIANTMAALEACEVRAKVGVHFLGMSVVSRKSKRPTQMMRQSL